MNFLKINLLVFVFCFSSSVSASDCAVGYAHMQNGKYQLAYKEFRALAERGYPVYMNTIADMHQKGQGVPASNMMAHIWYSLSAAVGNQKGVKRKADLVDTLSKQQLSDSHYIAKDYAKDYLEPYAVSWSLEK